MVVLTRDPVRILRNPLLPSGYACVYLKHDCRPQFVARPFRKLHLGNYPTERDAASAAAEWWLRAYGPDWPAFFAYRARLAWLAVRCPGPVTVLRDDGRAVIAQTGFRLICWELGVRRIVFPPPADSGPCPVAFASRRQAKRYFRDWRLREYGERHPLMIRRAQGSVHVPDWALARGGSGFPVSAE